MPLLRTRGLNRLESPQPLGVADSTELTSSCALSSLRSSAATTPENVSQSRKKKSRELGILRLKAAATPENEDAASQNLSLPIDHDDEAWNYFMTINYL